MTKQTKITSYLIFLLLIIVVGKTLTDLFIGYREALLVAEDLKEEDPLTIWSTNSSKQILPQGCELKLYRGVKLTKGLVVDVTRTFHTFKGYHSAETTTLPSYTFREPYPINKVVTYNLRIPDSFTDGLYLYQPVLTYKVNEHLTISKRSPTQLFEVDSKAECK